MKQEIKKLLDVIKILNVLMVLYIFWDNFIDDDDYNYLYQL